MSRSAQRDDGAGAPGLSPDERSQLAERLRWSPSERLRYLLDMLEFEDLARRARRVDDR